MSRQDILDHFRTLSESGIPEEVERLTIEELKTVNELIEGILLKERAGLDSLFSVMTHTMKFIPNILLVSLTSKYIEPPISARICAHLTLKQAVSIANGLNASYVAETSRYMEPDLSAELLSQMKKAKGRDALKVMNEKHPQHAQRIISKLSSYDRKQLVET